MYNMNKNTNGQLDVYSPSCPRAISSGLGLLPSSPVPLGARPAIPPPRVSTPQPTGIPLPLRGSPLLVGKRGVAEAPCLAAYSTWLAARPPPASTRSASPYLPEPTYNKKTKQETRNEVDLMVYVIYEGSQLAHRFDGPGQQAVVVGLGVALLLHRQQRRCLQPAGKTNPQ